MSVCCEYCVLSGRGLCDELIIRPEESYRLWCVVVCDLETTKILVNKEEAKAQWGTIAPRDVACHLHLISQVTAIEFLRIFYCEEPQACYL